MVSQPESELTVLPYRDADSRILYPMGRFNGWYVLQELREFERRGGKVLGVKHCFGTNESYQPYQEFVSRLYNLRAKTSNDAERLFFKLLLNNLYGRLGATGKIGRSVVRSELTEPRGTPYGEKVLVNYHMPLSEEVNWCHAAYVTSYGRLELLKYMDLIGAERLIYTDTDSTIFDCPRKQLPFKVGGDLGAMKLESWERHAVTYAPKQYQVGEHYKAKGVPRRLAKTFIEKGFAQFDLPFKLRESVAFYDRDNSKQLSVWRTVERRIVSTYDKKILSGNRFFPCHLNEKS